MSILQSAIIENDISTEKVENRAPCDISTGMADLIDCGPSSVTPGETCCIKVVIFDSTTSEVSRGTEIRYFSAGNGYSHSVTYTQNGGLGVELCFDSTDSDSNSNVGIYWESSAPPFLECAEIDLAVCGCP